jgi:hypothetical protein
MSEPLIDYNVRAFAKYLDCDPELAQELYFSLGVSLSLDDENKEDLNVNWILLRPWRQNLHLPGNL